MVNSITKRPTTAFINVVRYFLIPIGSILIAFLVTEKEGHALWGNFIEFLIVASLFVTVMAWGGKDHLLREISLNPKNLKVLVTSNLLARVSLFIVLTPFLFIFYSPLSALLLAAWILGALIQSILESLVQYFKHLITFTILELAVLISSGAYLWFQPECSVEDLLIIFTLQASSKGIFVLIYYARHISFEQNPQILQDLKLAFPLFLIGLSGMLFSKVDIWVINGFEDDEFISKYQIFMTCIIYLQAVGGYSLMPFQKLIYRLKQKNIGRLVFKFGIFGILVSLFGISATYGLLHFYFDFTPTIFSIIAGMMCVWPIFFCLPIIHHLYALRKEKFILLLNFVGFALNGTLTIFLVPKFGYQSAIMTSAVSQILMLIGYLIYFNRLKLRRIEN